MSSPAAKVPALMIPEMVGGKSKKTVSKIGPQKCNFHEGKEKTKEEESGHFMVSGTDRSPLMS